MYTWLKPVTLHYESIFISSVLRVYEEQMFIIPYELFVINANDNSPLSEKHPAICRSTVIIKIGEASCNLSSLNKVAAC